MRTRDLQVGKWRCWLLDHRLSVVHIHHGTQRLNSGFSHGRLVLPPSCSAPPGWSELVDLVSSGVIHNRLDLQRTSLADAYRLQKPQHTTNALSLLWSVRLAFCSSCCPNHFPVWPKVIEYRWEAIHSQANLSAAPIRPCIYLCLRVGPHIMRCACVQTT